MHFTLAELLGLLGAPFLSMLVGWLTASTTPAKIKTWLLVGLSAIYAVVEEFIASPDGFNIGIVGVKFLAAFITAANVHSAFSKNVGLSAALQATGLKIGAQPEPPPEPAPTE